MQTLCPASLKAVAMACPMPRFPPVTRTVWGVFSGMGFLPVFLGSSVILLVGVGWFVFCEVFCCGFAV